jgi:polysaccharide deacetylase family protein (PEP-CTERM system associated)
VRNVFTVDLEEWFHICGVGGPLAPSNWDHLPSRVERTTRALLDALDQAGVTATFFVLGWVARRHPRLIEDVRNAGHEIGSHGYAHQRTFDLDPDAFRSNLRRSMAALADAGSPTVAAFRAPEWSANERTPWAFPILVEHGFTVDASMAPVKLVGDVRYPRTPHVLRTSAGPLLELPPLVADRVGQVMPIGWGWGLRMSSPRRVLRAVEAANRAGHAAVLTVHPWEIDDDPPRVPLSPRLWFAHYFRLNGFLARLREVLPRGGFGTARDFAQQVPISDR